MSKQGFSRWNIWIVTPDEWEADGAYKGNVPFNKERWRESVEKALFKIEGTAVGRALFARILLGPAVTIRPHPIGVYGRPDAACYGNGGATREVHSAARVRNRLKHDGFTGEIGNLGDLHVGGVVAIEPENLEKGSHCYKNVKNLSAGHDYGSEPDEVLFHELIHAQRGAARIADGSKQVGPALKHYTNVEEFLAVVITNVYISNKGGGLRRGHSGFELLEKDLSTSIGFYKSSPEVLGIVTQFAGEDPFFYALLAEVNTGFNPFRAHKYNRAAVEKVSYAKIDPRAVNKAFVDIGKTLADGLSAYARGVLGR